jgi:LacI family transcriptional regulator
MAQRGDAVAKTILRDVAEVAGVSLRTASRVLNEDPRVAIATRARVQQAMRDLKFTPDAMARSLRSGTDTAVGMVVESVADPFFSAMVAAVEQAESTSGKSVLVASTHGDPARERDVVAHMLTRRVSGMLLAPTADDHAWLDTRTPLVLVDRAARGLDTDVVGIDDEAAAADAVDHLVAHGHRRIAYISDQPLVPTSRARLAGYRRAMAAHGLDVEPRLVRADCPDGAAAAAATRDLLSRKDSGAPTAVFSADTRCSLGVVPTLHAMGRTDVALVSFGDFAMADLLQPGVTVVDHSAEAVGAAAAARLAERIANPGLPATTIHVPVRLIPRGSGELRP